MGFLTCKYRRNASGEIESEMFDSDEIPDGWLDSPANLSNGSEPVMENPPESMPDAPEHMNGLTDVSDPVEPRQFRKKRKKRGN